MKTRMRLYRILNILTLLSMVVFALQVTPAKAESLQAAGAYNIKWSAADPAVNRGPYLPTYTKYLPSQLPCLTPSGGTGRAAEPLMNAVYLSPLSPYAEDAVTSLAPKDMALGQIVPFEVEIKVTGSVAPENGTIQFTGLWNTHTTNGSNIGYDPTYMVYCAFVDTADHGTVDPGGDAKVDSWTSTLLNPGGEATEAISGAIQVSGLDDGDTVIVEVWVVLKSILPATIAGNIQSSLVDAYTVATPPDKISTGNQTVPLLKPENFVKAVADISITKSDSPDPVVAGNLLTYSLLITNHSIDTVSNGIVVTDILDPNTSFVSASGATCTVATDTRTLTCNAGFLSPGTNKTITITMLVAETAPTAGTVNTGTCTVGGAGVDLCNRVSMTSITEDTNTVNNSDSEPTNVTAFPHISLTKSAGTTSYNAAGQVINYTLVATNDGNTVLHNVSISDPMLGELSCTPAQPVANLAAGETLTCTASYTITQADVNTGRVQNTATTTGTFASQTYSDTADATITGSQNPALTIVKTATPSVYDSVGDVISYSYLVTNSGNITLYNISVVDDKATTTCPDTSGGLAPLGQITCTASYTIQQAELDSGSVTNSAYATDGTTQSQPDSETVNADQKRSLSLVKSADPAIYSAVGQSIDYSYEVTNTGNVTLLGPVTVTDDKVTVSCPIGNLAPGASIACTASHEITQADLDAGSITNTAQAHAGSVASNIDTEIVWAEQMPALKLTKSADIGTYDHAGQVISYTYVIENTGNITLSGPFSVADDKAGDEACAQPADGALSPGETMTCTASYAATQTDLDASFVTNLATATNGTVTSNQATVTVYAEAKPNLSLVKTADPLIYDAVGDVISYNYEVTNIGNVAVHGPYTLSDDRALDEACPQTPDPLPVGSSITCTASYTVTQADLDAGSVNNKATASATFGGNPVISNEAQATVTADQNPALAIDKTATEAVYAAVGTVIHYSYKVTNTGNVTLYDDISVNDNKTTAVCPALPPDGLAPGEFITCAATYTILQSDLDAGSLTNVAWATDGTVSSPTDTVTIPATQSPALSLDKKASPATYSAAGEIISYTYDLTNSGNVTLNGPFTVSDDQAAVSCPADVISLAPGDTVTCTASHVVTQAEVDGGSITNVARGRAVFDNMPVDSNQDSETVTANQVPALSIVKTASPSTYDAVGDVISYSYLVTNSGNVTLYNITVVDDKADDESCPDTSGGLAPGASITCLASYAVTQADLDSGSVTNTAYATDGTISSQPDQETVSAITQGGLGLSKSADSATYDAVNDVITYTYVVQNTGNITLAGPFTVNDDKAGAVSCPSGSLAPLATVTCTTTYSITQADLDAGSLTNTATATDGTLISNEASATVVAIQSPALAIEKSAAESGYDAVNDVIHYSYLVTNTGNVTLHDPITVSDDKAEDEACEPLPAGGLAPGASITCMASYIIMQSDLDAALLTNVASAASGSTVSPTDTVTIPATQNPALSLDKSANPVTYTTVGQEIAYDYLLTNTGNVTLSGPFKVSDDKATVVCPAEVTSLAPGETLHCTATYTITQADIDSGAVTNVASAAASFNDTAVNSNEDTVIIEAIQSPALSLVKSASPSTYDAVGDVISYSYLVTNSGNVTLDGPLSVADDKVTNESCPAVASLAPGASITCNASYIITQADLDSGSVINVAKAKGVFGGEDVFSNEDSQTVNAVPEPALALTKSALPATYDQVSQTITYSYELQNTGNVTLTGPFSVSDDKASVTCQQPATLAVGATLTCNATYTITQADLDAGSVTNIAAGHAQTLGETPVNSNNASATVNAVPMPALSLVKTADPATYDAAGDVISYSYLVTNSGNVTLHDAIVISDNKATDESCPALPAEGLAPGASITCTASYTIMQTDLDAGSVTNTASAASGLTVSNEDSETVTADQKPALAIVKSASPSTYDAVGDVISYSYLVTNSGNVTLYDISVVDNKTTVTCPGTAAGLAPGASITCTSSYTITLADLNGGLVKNTAYATDGTTESEPDDETVTAEQMPALDLTKEVDEENYDAVGDVLHYVLVATNTGNVTLTGVTISDPKLGTLECDLAQPVTLNPGERLSCRGEYTIQQADLNAGKVENTGTVYGAAPDQSQVTDTASESVPALQRPGLRLDKLATPHFSDPVKVGDTISYTLTARNTGNITLTNVTITDAKLGSLTCNPAMPATLAPNAMLSCTGSYTITQADIEAGLVSNVGIADSDQTNPVEDDNDVPVPQAPHLSLSKSGVLDMTVVPPADRADVGDTITYTLTAVNDGNLTLTGVVISDALIDELTCNPDQPATLAPGASLTCGGSYAITQADIDAGKVSNTGIADSVQTPPVETPNEETLPLAPGLSLVKSASPATYDAVGDVISYSYLVTNTGNVTLFNITVTDDKAIVTCPSIANGLAPLGTITCTASYTIKQADLNAGSVTNTAYAKSGSTQSQPDSETVTAVQNPVLKLAKSATPATYDAVGDVISYQFTLTNDGNVTLSAPFTVTDDHISGAFTCSSADTLAPGGTITCTRSYTVTLADLDAGSVTNKATATGRFGGTTVTSNEAQATVTAVAKPALHLTKSAAPATYDSAGDVISYSYVVKNTGNVTLSGPFTIADDKSIDEACTQPADNALSPGEEMTCTATYTITQANLDAGSVTNKATATNGTVTSNEANATVTAVLRKSLSLVKTASPAEYEAVGDIITYSYLLTNTGNVTLSAPYTVADNKATDETCPDTPATLAPGESVTCTATYTITAADITARSVTNKATATAKFNATTVTSNEATATVLLKQQPSIDITKGPDMQQVKPEGKATWTVTVTNTGNVPLHNIVVSDPAVPACNKTITSLAVGASTSYTCSYTFPSGYRVTEPHTVLYDFANTVTVTALSPENVTVTDSDDAFVDILPLLDVQKYANPREGLPYLGGTARYTIMVYNLSVEPVTLTTLYDDQFGELLGGGAYSTVCRDNVGNPYPLPITLAPKKQPGYVFNCYFEMWISGEPGTYHTNTVTATIQDNEGNSASDSATAKIYLYWNGLTPGFWKQSQHYAKWPEPYVPSMLVQDVFTIPTYLLTPSGKLDLNGDTKADTLLAALNYKGGSTLKGKAQILLRAATAALLNEAKFGDMYPPYSSVEELTAAVNAALASQNAVTMNNLAKILDRWNNGTSPY